MPSFLDQYQKREGSFTNQPEPTSAPDPKDGGGIVSKIKRLAGGSSRVAPAPQSRPDEPIKPLVSEDFEPQGGFLQQFQKRRGAFETEGPSDVDLQKTAGMAATLDETPEELRAVGEYGYNLQTPGQLSFSKPQVTLPTQDQLDNPRIAKAYREAIEAQRPPTLIKRLADGYGAYHSGATRQIENLAIGEFGTVSSMLGYMERLGVTGAKAPADAIDNWIESILEERQDDGFTDHLVQGVGSSAVFFLPGLGVARGAQALASISPKLALLFGGSASAALESVAEAGNVYRAVVSEKHSESEIRQQSLNYDPAMLDDDAREAADRTFFANMILVTLTNRLGIFNPNASGFVRRMVFSAPIEAVQEAGQQIISNVALEQDPLEGTFESFLIGGIVGGLMGGGVEVLLDTSGPTTARQQAVQARQSIFENENTVFRWAGDTEIEAALNAHPRGTVGEGSYFAFDPESSAAFGNQLETFSLPENIRVLDATAGIEVTPGFSGSVESLSINNPVVKAAFEAGFTNETLLEYAQEQGYDAVKFFADDGVSKWLAVRPDLDLSPKAEAAAEVETETETDVTPEVPVVARVEAPGQTAERGQEETETAPTEEQPAETTETTETTQTPLERGAAALEEEAGSVVESLPEDVNEIQFDGVGQIFESQATGDLFTVDQQGVIRSVPAAQTVQDGVQVDVQDETVPTAETARVLELTPEDLDKQIDTTVERLLDEGAAPTRDIAIERARQEVRQNVTLEDGRTVPRPDQIVKKTQVRHILGGREQIDFRVATIDGRQFLTFEDGGSRVRLRPRALGLVEEELQDGDTIRVSAKNLKEKGTALRATGKSGGALAFNIKNLENGTESKEANEEIDKIVSRSEIAERLAKDLGVPVRTGQFREAALGIFKPWAHVVRLKSKLGDIRIPVLVHEAAHFIDFTLLGKPTKTKKGKSWITEKFVSDRIPRKELDPLLEEYGGTPKSKKREAFAEFVRYWVTEPQKAQERAPEFLQIWENEILPDFPEVRDTLEATKRDWERWNEAPAIAKLVSQISFKKKTPKLEDAGEIVVQTWHDQRSQWTDDLYPVRLYRDLANEKGVDFSFEEDPYMLARLSRGWVGKASVFLEKGTFDVRFWKEVNGRAEPAFTGKGFSQIIEPIAVEHATEDFAAYLVARRAINLNERDIHSGINNDVATKAMEDLTEKHPNFAEVAAELDTYQDSLLDYLFQSGLLTRESLDNMKNVMKDYVPFYRVIEEAERKGLSGRTLADIRNPIKRIKGSDRDIINPLESIVKNTYVLINAAERNRVAMAMANLSTKHPELGQLFEKVPEKKVKVAGVKINELIEQVSTGTFFGSINGEAAKQELGEMGEKIVNIFRPSFFNDENVVTVMINGRPQNFLADKDIYKALHATEVEDVALVWKILSYPARWLRAGATLTPEFIVRNPARDLMSAAVYSEYGFFPPVDVARGLYGALAKDNDFWLWRMGGGAQSMLVSMDRTTLSKTYDELALEHDLTPAGVIKRGFKYAVNPIESLRLVSEFTEKMTRIGEAKKGIEQGANPLEAAFASREVTLDFAKVGSKGRAVNMIVAFWNAQVQGSVRFARAMSEAPVRTFTKTTLYITLPSVLLALWNSQEDDWEEIPQWQKNLFWMIKIPNVIPDQGILDDLAVTRTSDGIWLRWPKPFELGIIFGSLPERMVENIYSDNPNLFPELRKAILDGAVPGVMPTAALPIIENITNYSFFLDRNIVPDSLEGLPAFAQYSTYTSEAAKRLGRVFNISPAQIDNFVNGYFAGLGRYATQIIDRAILMAEGKDAPEKPSPTAADIPLIRAFVVRDPRSSSSESINRFYVEAEKARAAKNYHNDLLERGQAEEAQQWFADNVALISLSQYYESVRKNLSNMRRIQNMIRDSKTLTPEEKREQLDDLGREMTFIANQAINVKIKEE